MTENHHSVSNYLLKRMEELGIGHLFGVPGDYVLNFLDEVMISPIKWVGTCNELNAGYAADGYARINGIGGAVVTYSVGGLSILNAVAGAFAERIPLIVISGAPPLAQRKSGALVHHLIADYGLQLEIFRKVTCDAAVLTDPDAAPDIIDRILVNCITMKLPVYLEIPSDIAQAPCLPPKGQLQLARQSSDETALAECIAEAARMLNNAKHPLVLAGIELPRMGLGDDVLRLVETMELPFATMLSSKSVMPELHPQFSGVYQGKWSHETVRRQVEDSDCLLALGVWMTDLDTGLFSVNFERDRMISAAGNGVCIGKRHYQQIQLADFIKALPSAVKPRPYLSSHPAEVHTARKTFVPELSRPLSARRLYECLDSFLDDRMVLLAEPGDAFCAAPEFHIEEARNFIVQPYYCSIGFCTPAALGVGLASPEKRPVVLTGDGAFQMTAQEVSTLLRENCPALIILVNNDGYLIERMLHKDNTCNDIKMWQYSKLPGVFDDSGRSVGVRVSTEEELVRAMEMGVREKDKLVLIDAVLPQRDCSAGLERLGQDFRRAQNR